MYRLIWSAALVLAACGTENDQRPRTVEYITQAILVPNCGNAQCHSSFRKAENLVFDNLEDAQRNLVGRLVGVISLNAQDEPEGDAASSELIHVLTRTVDRMPWDQPLPDADIDLIARWIDFGAPGAQCDPSAGAKVCVGTRLVDCKPSYDYGAVTDCADTGMSCSSGACR